MANMLADLLHDNPALLATVFRHVGEAVIASDAAGRIVYSNHAAQQLFGLEAEAMLGMAFRALSPPRPEDASLVPPREGHSSRSNYLRGDGAIFLGETVSAPYRDEQNGMLHIIRVASAGERAVHVLQSLHAITSDARLGVDGKIQAILQLGAEHFGLPLGIQSRVDGDSYTVEACVDPADALQPGASFDVGGTYCAHTLEAQAPTGFHHAGQSAIRAHPCYRSQRLEAYLGAPIYVNGTLHGTLNYSRKESCRPFSGDDLALMQLLAHWTGNAISEDRQRERLERLAHTDPLTGLLNRRAILEQLAWQHAHANRSGLPLSVVLLDIDHFKQVNDQHGHDVGDKVICRVADLLRSTSREVDLCARFGGEEFLVVLPDTDADAASVFCSRLLHNLRQAVIDTPQGDQVTVTASLGVGQATAGDTTESLTRRADQAMYEAKASGRAAVRIAPKP